MKRLFQILLPFVIILLLSACGSEMPISLNDEYTNIELSPDGKKVTIKIGLETSREFKDFKADFKVLKPEVVKMIDYDVALMPGAEEYVGESLGTIAVDSGEERAYFNLWMQDDQPYKAAFGTEDVLILEAKDGQKFDENLLKGAFGVDIGYSVEDGRKTIDKNELLIIE